MSAGIAKYYLTWSCVSLGWALVVLQGNVHREPPTYSDFLLEVLSVPVFSLFPKLDLDVTLTWSVETFLRRV